MQDLGGIRSLLVDFGVQKSRSLCSWFSATTGWGCEPYYLYAAILGIIIFLVIALGKVTFARTKKRGNTVILVGLCDSGKTTLFLVLRTGRAGETVTSMTVNEDTFCLYKEPLNGKPVHIVDFPGFHRLRSDLYKKYINQATGIIFLVDAVEFGSHVSAVGEYLYELFTHPVIQEKKLPMLIACSKSEVATAKSAVAVKKELESELNQVRQTQASKPKAQGGTVSEDVFLGIEGKTFKMEQLPMLVEFAEFSSKSGNIDSVRQFIRKLVPP